MMVLCLSQDVKSLFYKKVRISPLLNQSVGKDVNWKNQPSIDTFVTGKRQAGDISSPGDGAVCSPEEKSQKASSK